MFDCSWLVSCTLTSKFVGRIKKKLLGSEIAHTTDIKLSKGKPNTKRFQPETK